jgi:hypothetical protein
MVTALEKTAGLFKTRLIRIEGFWIQILPAFSPGAFAQKHNMLKINHLQSE